jgi:RNA polymerase sigma-70 factor (ECF subfamily)
VYYREYNVGSDPRNTVNPHLRGRSISQSAVPSASHDSAGNPPADPALARLIERARGGEAEAVTDVLERYRAYLRSIASRHLGSPLARRMDASDLVQQTFLEAHRQLDVLFACDEPQLRAALRHILRCNLANAIRDHLYAGKRQAGREENCDADLIGPNGDPSPSMQVAHRELADRFVEIIGELPPDQADAVRMRYFEGLSVGDIAAALGRSRTAAAGLIKRGLVHLRAAFQAEGSQWR